ncbi:MAG: tetratricopeptide repeat protein, partial [Gammaproteobacteria bacterium]|nr:tetratricopeptide repeat protein [Gammaproteobacteria bacterium]
SGLDYFNQGVKKAELGDYPAALVQFQKAKKAGLDTAALNYNFAVVFYKLGQYEEARKVFTDLTNVPRFEQIAYFNLGLVANKQKDEFDAARWFRRAYRSDIRSEKNTRIKVLAAEALKRLNLPLRKTRTSKAWTGFLSGSLASDSNVALLNDDLVGVTSQSDTSVSLSAYGARWLKGRENNGVRLFLNGHLQNYSSHSQYNFSQFSIGAARYDRLGDWRMRFGGAWDEIYFGGSNYQRLASMEVRARKSLSNINQLRLRYKASRIHATDPLYSYLEGWRQQFRVGNQMKLGATKYRAYYQLELNFREDREYRVGAEDLFTSYSPTRHMLRVTGWWKLPSSWVLQVDGRYRYSEYKKDNILVGGVTERRDDTQSRASVRLSKKLSKEWELKTTYTITSNDSSVGRKSYDRTLFGAGVTWKY